jgi:tripartite-type tricarboxylate transporter receptor subunit TctC
MTPDPTAPRARSRRRTLAALALAPALLSEAGAQQAAWPARPLRLIVPFPPGGAADTSARLVATRLGEALAQPVVVESRPGAGGNIATTAVTRAAADGYTLLLGAAYLSVNPTLYRNAGYDPVTELAPLGRFIESRLVFIAPAGAPPLREMLERARRTGTPIRLASAGTGTLSQLTGEMLKVATGTPMVHVPYKGSGPALTDIIGGQVDLMVDALASALAQIRGGRARALAVPERARNPLLPDVPTLAELGVPDIDVRAWNAFFAPAGTPAPVLARLREEFERILATPAIADELRSRGLEIAEPIAPERFTARMQAEIALWKRIIAEAGVTPE